MELRRLPQVVATLLAHCLGRLWPDFRNAKVGRVSHAERGSSLPCYFSQNTPLALAVPARREVGRWRGRLGAGPSTDGAATFFAFFATRSPPPMRPCVGGVPCDGRRAQRPFDLRTRRTKPIPAEIGTDRRNAWWSFGKPAKAMSLRPTARQRAQAQSCVRDSVHGAVPPAVGAKTRHHPGGGRHPGHSDAGVAHRRRKRARHRHVMRLPLASQMRRGPVQ